MTPRGKPEAFLRAALEHRGIACLMWPFATQTRNGGYGVATLNGRRGHAHRFMCELVYGPPPSRRHQAAHQCGNKTCVNPQHLRWATRAENERDKLRHGRSNRGSRSGHSKLTEADVLAIRAQPWRRGIDLAAEYGVAEETISHIRTGQNWRWL